MRSKNRIARLFNKSQNIFLKGSITLKIPYINFWIIPFNLIQMENKKGFLKTLFDLVDILGLGRYPVD